ncbi:sugar phosphate nucleotidyltransferase, partial [Akkermansiaceae bacterium]|nr:sugar phosphate nucleotidyltransferase [Akkermansiaceae bacterium]
RKYRGANLTFFYEPELLETGGGIKNIADWIKDDPLLIYNGDIITDLPIDRLMTGHMASNNTATLAVQDHGPDLRITVNGHRVTDVRGLINQKEGTHQFTGIYVIDHEILDLIPSNKKISIIPAFVELINQSQLGVYHVKGHPKWLDLGTRKTYLEASLALNPQVSKSAKIHPTASVQNSWIAQDAIVEPGATIKDSILWPGTHVLQDAELTNCIVHTNSPTSGVHNNADL